MRLAFRRINRLFSTLLPRGPAHPYKKSRETAFARFFVRIGCPTSSPLFFCALLGMMCETCAGGCKRASIQSFPEKKQEKHDESLRYRRKSQLPQGYSINQSLVYINQALNYINQTLNYINQTLVYRFPLSQLTFSLTF